MALFSHRVFSVQFSLSFLRPPRFLYRIEGRKLCIIHVRHLCAVFVFCFVSHWKFSLQSLQFHHFEIRIYEISRLSSFKNNMKYENAQIRKSEYLMLLLLVAGAWRGSWMSNKVWRYWTENWMAKKDLIIHDNYSTLFEIIQSNNFSKNNPVQVELNHYFNEIFVFKRWKKTLRILSVRLFRSLESFYKYKHVVGCSVELIPLFHFYIRTTMTALQFSFNYYYYYRQWLRTKTFGKLVKMYHHVSLLMPNQRDNLRLVCTLVNYSNPIWNLSNNIFPAKMKLNYFPLSHNEKPKYLYDRTIKHHMPVLIQCSQ